MVKAALTGSKRRNHTDIAHSLRQTERMYELHYAPDNASLIIRIVLEQAGIPYRTALVDRATRAQDKPAYRALNPVGLIPTLITPHGPISETGAILLWLGDRHGLCPAPSDPARPALLKWLFFLSNTAHADIRQLFYPHLYVPPGAVAEHFTLISTRMIGHFALLDQAAGSHAALFSPGGLLLPYTAALMRWSVLYPATGPRWFDLAACPNLKPGLQQLQATPAAQSVAQAEGLGTTLFTAPILPSPPEGTAL
jgi:glutathione S-transferase